jgi:hypothetical protein
MKLIEWYQSSQTKKLSPSKRTTYKGWDSLKKVAIYFEASSLNVDELKAWEALFSNNGALCSLMSYQDLKRKELHATYQYPCFCKDEKNWWGWPKPQEFATYQSREYDMYLDLSASTEAFHDIIGSSMRASIKVAFKEKKSTWADLIVNGDASPYSASCREEVLALLKFINA